MKSLLLLIFFSTVTVFAQTARDSYGPTLKAAPPIDRVKLTDGRVLHLVEIRAYGAAGVTVRATEGAFFLAYELFPQPLRGQLEHFRPSAADAVKVTGDFVEITKPAPPPEIIPPNAPLPAPGQVNYHFGGQLNLTHAGDSDHFLADATVCAIHPDVYAAYQKKWLEKYADLIKTLGTQFRTAEPAARWAAYARASIVLYGSMDPLPETLAEARTDSKGRFDLACTEPTVFLIIRAHLFLGGNQVAYVWALPAQSGPPISIDLDNLLMPYDYQYEGRINIAGPDQPPSFLPNVSVYAVTPAAFEAFNRQRLEKFGATIDSLSGQIRTAAPAARADAYARASVILYGSMDPLPPAVAETRTDAHGSFRLVCTDPSVYMIARTHLPMGQNQIGFVWAARVQPGHTVDFNLKNMLLRY